MLAATTAPAAIRFVDVNNPNPVPSYDTWATAATNIQDAVDAPEYFGDQVLVTNGVYRTGGELLWALTNRVYVSKQLSIRSVNGPEFTFIEGNRDPLTTSGEAARCTGCRGPWWPT